MCLLAQEPPTSEEGDGDYSLEEDMPEEDEGSDEEENDDNRDQVCYFRHLCTVAGLMHSQ